MSHINTYYLSLSIFIIYHLPLDLSTYLYLLNLSIHPCIHASMRPSIHPSLCLSLSLFLSISLSLYLYLYLSISSYLYLSIHLSAYVFAYPCIYHNHTGWLHTSPSDFDIQKSLRKKRNPKQTQRSHIALFTMENRLVQQAVNHL